MCSFPIWNQSVVPCPVLTVASDTNVSDTGWTGVVFNISLLRSLWLQQVEDVYLQVKISEKGTADFFKWMETSGKASGDGGCRALVSPSPHTPPSAFPLPPLGLRDPGFYWPRLTHGCWKSASSQSPGLQWAVVSSPQWRRGLSSCPLVLPFSLHSAHSL